MSDHDESRFPVPADVERPDRLMAGLTARQLAELATVGLVLWLIYLAVGGRVPVSVELIAGGLVVAVTVAVVLGRRDGLPLDRFLLAAFRHTVAPHQLVAASDRVEPPPAWIDTPPVRLPAPLRLPAHAIRGDGVIDLGPQGHAVVIACTTVNFSLYTPEEQDDAIGAFARVLHGLSLPAQVLVRARRADLTPLIAHLAEMAPTLPHPALEDAALAHAEYLTELADHRDLLRRDVLLILRQPAASETARARDGAALALTRAAEEAAQALTACGLTARLLDGTHTAAVLSDSTGPGHERPSGTAPADAVVTYAPDTGDPYEAGDPE